MSRIRFVFGSDGNLYEKGKFPPGVTDPNDHNNHRRGGPAIHMDYEPFVSPIDGTLISGRRAYREHCQKHDVVPTRELKGLPVKPAAQEYKPDRAAIREELKKNFYK
jgi:hypothetical protein